MAGLNPKKFTFFQQQFFLHLPMKEKILFAKRFSILLKSGVPIMQSVSMLKEQAGSVAMRKVLSNLAIDVENGQEVHTSLAKHKNLLGDFVINIIRVGEAAGHLDENLMYLADELKKKHQLQKKVINSLIYPLIIISATLVMALVLTVVVFPKILPIIQSLKAHIPWSTRLLMLISNLVTHHWLILVFVCLILFFSAYFFLKHPKSRLWLDGQVVFLPLFGNIYLFYNISNICRSFGLLLKSEVGIVEAAKITARTTSNLAYKKVLKEFAEALTRGERFSEQMLKHPRLFPPMVRQMTEVGEVTGNLSYSLGYLAEIYEAEVDDLTKNLSTVIEPVLMLFMGVMVGFIAISIITPIYSITQSLR